jgi:hypothetical protein
MSNIKWMAASAFIFAFVLGAQQNGRFASLKSQALTMFERGQYDQVAGKLEEIWEQDQSDPKVAEYLAIGYLYGEHNVAKAKPVMQAAIARGGQATFLVRHSHDKSGILSGDTINNYCSGRMSMVRGKLSFTADSGEHSVEIPANQLKGLKTLGGSPGRIEIKSAAKTYLFRVKSETNAEALFLAEMVTQHVK